MILVSIIIPCYNQAHYLRDAIDSCLAQTYPHVEVIVVNDGSPDNTAEVVTSYGSKIKYIFQENSGLCAARNAGARGAQGDWLHFLDADDYLKENTIEQVLAAYTQNPNVGVFYCGYNRVNQEGASINFELPRILEPDPFHVLIEGNLPPPVCFTVKRTAFEDVGFFDTNMSACADWDIWVRLAAANVPFALVDSTSVFYRVCTTSMSKNYALMWEDAKTVLQKAMRYHTHCIKCEIALSRGWENIRSNYYFAMIDIHLGQIRQTGTKPQLVKELVRFLLSDRMAYYYIRQKLLRTLKPADRM